MKIAIVTFHEALNYGAVLQAYALQTHLEKSGHEVSFVNWNFPFTLVKGRLQNCLSRSPRQTFRNLHDYVLGLRFAQFRKNHLRVGVRQYGSAEDLIRLPPDADAYIVGSDQVWNPVFAVGPCEKTLWLRFGRSEVRRIAYAASFGLSHLDKTLTSRWSDHAKLFDAVSVREKGGQRLAGRLGRPDAVVVPDPTHLLSPEDYARIAPTHAPMKRPYVFAYIFDTDNGEFLYEVEQTVREVAGLSIRRSRPVSRLRNFLSRGVVGPGKWLSLLRQSQYVVTNSFHGTALSILFHRPFIVVLYQGAAARLNGRVTSLLEILGLEHRAVTTYDRREIERLCHEDIDWEEVHRRLSALRQVGVRFLEDALA